MGFSGFFHIPNEAGSVSRVRDNGGESAVGRGQASADKDAHAVFGALGKEVIMEGSGGEFPDQLAEGVLCGSVYCAVGISPP